MGELLQTVFALLGAFFIFRLVSVKSDVKDMKRDIEKAKSETKKTKEVHEKVARMSEPDLDKHLSDNWMRKQDSDSP